MWPWTALMYLVGIGNFSNFSVISVIELILFTFPLNFYLYGLNDVYDETSDRINDRKSAAQGIVVRESEIAFIKRYVWVAPAFFFVVAFFSQNIEHIILSTLFILLSFLYSHKTTRFKEIPIVDCFTSAAIYCVPGLIAYSLTSSIFTLPPQIFLILLPYAGVHALTTLADREADRATRMKTIAVAFGKYGTVAFSLIMFITAFIAFRQLHILASVFLVSILLQIMYLFIDEKESRYFDFALGAILVSFGMVSILYFILQANY